MRHAMQPFAGQDDSVEHGRENRGTQGGEPAEEHCGDMIGKA